MTISFESRQGFLCREKNWALKALIMSQQRNLSLCVPIILAIQYSEHISSNFQTRLHALFQINYFNKIMLVNTIYYDGQFNSSMDN